MVQIVGSEFSPKIGPNLWLKIGPYLVKNWYPIISQKCYSRIWSKVFAQNCYNISLILARKWANKQTERQTQNLKIKLIQKCLRNVSKKYQKDISFRTEHVTLLANFSKGERQNTYWHTKIWNHLELLCQHDGMVFKNFHEDISFRTRVITMLVWLPSVSKPSNKLTDIQGMPPEVSKLTPENHKSPSLAQLS